MGNEINNLYEFGSFKFDTKKSKLWRENELVLISPKATELLALLLEKNGEYVSKEEIFEKVWAGTFVEDGVLTQNIYTLRKALGNDEDGKPFIENRTRLGYRITAAILKESEESGVRSEEKKSDEKLAARNEEKIVAPQKSSYSLLLTPYSLLALIALLAIAAVAYFYFRSPIRKPIESVKFTRLTKTGNISNAVISPDGSLIAFTRPEGLFLQDIAAEKEIKIEIPTKSSVGLLQFSPDGNSLYFRNNRILTTQTEIRKISRFGGEAQTLVDRSWGSFSVSPDGKKIAYFLNVPPIANFNLKIKDLETGAEKEFSVAEAPHNPCGVCNGTDFCY
jgi:DNA-binding winged helix-turn-helix (wHTH) protein